MKTLFILITTLITVALTSCGTSNNFSKKKYLRIGSLAPAKTQTNQEATYIQKSEKNTLTENNVQVSVQLNVTQEDSSIIEDLKEAEPSVCDDEDLVKNDDLFVSNEVSLVEEEVSSAVEKPKTKFKSNKFLTKIEGSTKQSWGRSILIVLAIIILLPLVLIGVMVLYLYFFPMW